MKQFLSGSLLTTLAVLITASAAQAATLNVTVRVEGASATLLPTTRVALDTTGPAVGSCPADSAGAALDKATAGNWDKQAFTSTILGETHDFSDSDYWAEWVNNGYGSGVCNDLLHDGDAVLLIVDRTPAPDYASTAFPLTVALPATVQPGVPFTATVTQYGPDASYAPLSSVPAPAAGVTVAGGGASATTDAQGRATLTLTDPGPVQLKASQTTTRSDVATTCVTTGDDGFCGTSKPGDPPVTTEDPPPATTAPDRPLARLTGIREQKAFTPAAAPRTLSGTVTPGKDGLRRVQLRLTRNDRGRCFAYSAKYEKWLRVKRCSADLGRWFTVGKSPDFSYLLPGALTRGRYVLDVRAVDNKFNIDAATQRGENRVVFYVK